MQIDKAGPFACCTKKQQVIKGLTFKPEWERQKNGSRVDSEQKI